MLVLYYESLRYTGKCARETENETGLEGTEQIIAESMYELAYYNILRLIEELVFGRLPEE